MKTSKFKQTEIGIIPEDWEVKILDTITERVCVGYVGTCLKDFCDENVGIPLFRTTNLTDEGLSYTDLKYVTKEFHNRNKKSQLKKGDLLIARHGDNGKACIFDRDIEANCLNVVIVKPNQKLSSSKYLLYCFKSEIVKNQVMANVGGSVQGVVNTKIIQNLLFPYPSIQEQKAIAKILSDLDSKIEILQNQNKTLEKIGQTIFKHWFVDFEFPNEEGKPYKYSGGEMVDSELGEIPKGWSVEKLGDLISKNRKPIKNYEDWKDKDLIDLSNMPQFSMSITTFDKGEKFKSNIFELNEMDILFGSIRPYFGKYGFSPIKGAITGTVYSLKPKKEDHYAFILNIICRREFVDYTVRLSKGTKMPIIGWNDFSDFDMVTNKEIIIKFNKVIFPSILKIKTNILQILNLQKTRDLLLPKLMSGQIRVNVG